MPLLIDAIRDMPFDEGLPTVYLFPPNWTSPNIWSEFCMLPEYTPDSILGFQQAGTTYDNIPIIRYPDYDEGEEKWYDRRASRATVLGAVFSKPMTMTEHKCHFGVSGLPYFEKTYDLPLSVSSRIEYDRTETGLWLPKSYLHHGPGDNPWWGAETLTSSNSPSPTLADMNRVLDQMQSGDVWEPQIYFGTRRSQAVVHDIVLADEPPPSQDMINLVRDRLHEATLGIVGPTRDRVSVRQQEYNDLPNVNSGDLDTLFERIDITLAENTDETQAEDPIDPQSPFKAAPTR